MYVRVCVCVCNAESTLESEENDSKLKSVFVEARYVIDSH